MGVTQNGKIFPCVYAGKENMRVCMSGRCSAVTYHHSRLGHKHTPHACASDYTAVSTTNKNIDLGWSVLQRCDKSAFWWRSLHILIKVRHSDTDPPSMFVIYLAHGYLTGNVMHMGKARHDVTVLSGSPFRRFTQPYFSGCITIDFTLDPSLKHLQIQGCCHVVAM